MPANPSTTEMGRRHVEHVAEVLGITPSAASGSKWQNPADGRSAHDIPYPIAIECKSTRGKSLTETLDMIAKLREQALGETPVLPLRWYGTDDLTVVLEDWAAVPLDFLGELLFSARRWAEHEANPPMIISGEPGAVPVPVPASLEQLVRRADEAVSLRKALADAHDSLLRAGERIAEQATELELLRARQQADPGQAGHPLPMLPWTVAVLFPDGPRKGTTEFRNAARQADPREVIGVAYDYAADGSRTHWDIHTCHVDRSMDNRPKLFLDDVIAAGCDLYDRTGTLLVRVCKAKPEIEVG